MFDSSVTAQPNIILINCDDLGYGDLGCYSSERNSTPAIDRLAQEGMRFTDFYMAAPVCSPSRGAMLTGCYPRRIGFGLFEGNWVLYPGHSVGLHPDEITIASLLKRSGYHTKLIGKWHCGDQKPFLPTNHGFDEYYGLPYSNDMGYIRGSNHRKNQYPLPLMQDEEVIQEQPDQASLTERYTEEAVRYMRRKQNQPFFLYIAHMYVHGPLYAPRHFVESSQNGVYGAAVAAIDWSTDVILHELKSLNLESDTLVVFTSDNGGSNGKRVSNEPLRGHKGTTWEGGQRVPCIMRWPDHIPSNTVCSELVSAMDFLPTFAMLAGAKVPHDRIIDGKDISDLIYQKEGATSPYEAFFYYLRDDLEAVRSGKWKYHLKRHELYNLETDISETVNLVAQHSEIVDMLKLQAEQCRKDIGDAAQNHTGANCRPQGVVTNPSPLTEYDPKHPYIISSYD